MEYTPEEHIASLLSAARKMDWGQVVCNGGPPCFHLMEDGHFCGRAQSWPGHVHDTYAGDHKFVSLEALIEVAFREGLE